MLVLICTCAYAEEADMSPIFEFADNHGVGELAKQSYESALKGDNSWQVSLEWLRSCLLLPIRQVGEVALVSILPVMLLSIIRACVPESNGGSEGACFLLRMMLLLGLSDLAVLSLSAIESCIESIKCFSDTAAPVITAVLAMMGMNGTAALASPAATLVGNVAEGVFLKYGLPLSKLGLCCAIAGNLGDGIELSRFTKLMKKTANWGTGLVTTLFTGLISLQGTIAEAADNLGMRTAKFAADSATPVIGSGISDAWEGFVSGMMVTKNAFGVSGITTILAVGFQPLICCAAAMLVLNVTASMLELFGEKKAARAAEEIGGICQMALSLVTGSLVIVIVLIGAAMVAGRNLIA